MKVTEVHVCMGRTIPNPHQRYSTIKCEIGMTCHLQAGDTDWQALVDLKTIVRSELDTLLKDEITRSAE